MAIRFRRSIKICKGLKLNVNKNSVGLSVGGRGYGYTVNSKGRKTSHVGIPGTGLSVVNTKNPKSSSSASNSVANDNKKIVETTITMKIDNEGNMTYFYPNGTQITDSSVINTIVHTPGYKEEKERMIAARNQDILEEVNEFNDENEALININKLAPKRILDEAYYINELNSIVEKKYEVKQFDEPMPTVDEVKENLMKVAKEEIKGLFTATEKRYEYVQNNYERLFNIRMNFWNKKKEDFEQNEKKMEIEENKKYKEEFEKEKKYINDIIEGEEEAVCNSIDSWLEGMAMPLEFNVNYDYSHAKGIVYVDLDLPEIEDFPKQNAVQLANGTKKMKDKSQTELFTDYKNYVFGLAVFITGNIFNVSPKIKKVLISAYTQRRDKIGELVDDYIYSIKFDREKLSQCDLIDCDPYELCMQFENRSNVNTNNSLKTIEPYEK